MRKRAKKILIIIGVVIGLLLLLYGAFIVKFYSETGQMSSMDTQKVIEDVYAIQDTFVNLFIIKSGDKYIAVDAGNSAENVKKALDRLMIDPRDVVAVFLTHTDSDHVSALGLFDHAVIYLSKAEEQMINGQTSRFLFFKNRLAYEYKLVEDNQILDISGLQVRGILTPGHTPGSMCYLINERYLFAGDSMSLKNGKVGEFNDFFNMDSKTQRISIRKLVDLAGVKDVFTAHYGFTDNYQMAFDGWKN